MQCEIKVVHLDDSRVFRLSMANRLSQGQGGFRFEYVGVGSEAELWSELSLRAPDCVLLDLHLGNGERDGVNVLSRLRERDPELPVIVMSHDDTSESQVSCLVHAASDFLVKEQDDSRAAERIVRAVTYRRRLEESDGALPRRAVAATEVPRTPLASLMTMLRGKRRPPDTLVPMLVAVEMSRVGA